MKKILNLFIISSIAVIVACGPSAEEKAAKEKARQDSINAVMAQMAQMAQDSINAIAAIEKARFDSLAMVSRADSISKAGTKKPVIKAKPKTTISTKDTPKVGKKKPGAK